MINNQKGKDFFNKIPPELIAVKKQVPFEWLGGNGFAPKGAKNFASPQRNDFYSANWRTTADNIVGLWPIWEAISDPIIKLDAFPIFEKQDRPDYFLLPESYTAEGNQAIAEFIADTLKEINFSN